MPTLDEAKALVRIGSAETVSAVAEVLSDYPDVPLVSYLPALSWLDEDQLQPYLDAFRELILPATEVLVGNHKTLTDFLLPDWDSERPPSARELAVAAGEHGTRYVLVTGVMLPAKGSEQFIDNVLASPQGALTGEKFEMFDTAFVGAGEPLVTQPVEPVAEWICGPFAPLGGGRFHIALDRTWKTGAASYMAVQQDIAPGVRFGVQPVAVRLVENNEGAAQTIRFDPIPDVKAGTISLDLTAESDADLPVKFFVVAGPAIVTGKRLEFTAIPPRARFPIELSVAAWQWGRSAETKIKTAPMIRRTFRVMAPVP